MASNNGRLARIEAETNDLVERSATKSRNEDLAAVQAELLTMSKQEIIEWLEPQIDECNDSDLKSFLIDWRDFLLLEGDTRKDTIKNTPQLQHWHELQLRWGWPAQWTGKGLPPQLRELI